MLAHLKIEAIESEGEKSMKMWHSVMNGIVSHLGDEVMGKCPRRFWCAEIVGRSEVYRFERRFLKPKYDYRHANSKATRGIFVYYLLESGHLYEAKSPVSWSRCDRFFCTVADDGAIIRMDEDEAIAWLKANNLWE